MRSPEGIKKRQLSVGAFIILGIAVFFTFSLKMTDSPIFRRGSVVTVYISDATGIFVNSKVKLSGIDVGIVDKIELENLKAKITLVIDEGVELPDPAVVVPKPLGVLGDKYLEIQKATEDDLKRKSSDGSASNLKNFETRFSRLQAWLSEVVISSAHADGSTSRRVYKTGEVLPSRDQSAALDDMLRDVAKLSEDMKSITKEVREILGGNRKNIDSTIVNLQKISTDLALLTEKVSDDEVRKEIENLSKSVVQMGNTIRNMESISHKIQSGEGTLGKLVNDTETIDRVNDALGAVNATVDRAKRVQTWVDMHSSYLPQTSEVQTKVQLGLFTSYDFAYWAGVSIDDYGYPEETITRSVDENGTETTTSEIVRKPKSLKFNFLLSKRFSHASASVGILENSGGLQLEAFDRRERFKASLAIFDFGSDTNPITRLQFSYQPWSVFTISAGFFHAFESAPASESRKSWSIGAGLRFTDDDLKTILLIPGLG